jgi:hypothetical protein
MVQTDEERRARYASLTMCRRGGHVRGHGAGLVLSRPAPGERQQCAHGCGATRTDADGRLTYSGSGATA